MIEASSLIKPSSFTRITEHPGIDGNPCYPVSLVTWGNLTDLSATSTLTQLLGGLPSTDIITGSVRVSTWWSLMNVNQVSFNRAWPSEIQLAGTHFRLQQYSLGWNIKVYLSCCIYHLQLDVDDDFLCWFFCANVIAYSLLSADLYAMFLYLMLIL